MLQDRRCVISLATKRRTEASGTVRVAALAGRWTHAWEPPSVDARFVSFRGIFRGSSFREPASKPYCPKSNTARSGPIFRRPPCQRREHTRQFRSHQTKKQPAPPHTHVRNAHAASRPRKTRNTPQRGRCWGGARWRRTVPGEVPPSPRLRL